MSHLSWFVVVIGSCCAAESSDVSSSYQALRCPQPTVGTTWAILERDGANRKVEPYLSSLGQGETGTRHITSPPFVVERTRSASRSAGTMDRRGRGENYIALVDARKGTVLRRPPPRPMTRCRSDLGTWLHTKGTEVRMEVL